MSPFDAAKIGAKVDLGTHSFTAGEIIAFARKYDPQSFHLSEEGGRASVFGGLIASGWHTCAIAMKLIIAHREKVGSIVSTGVSPGFENLRWIKPVRPGMTLRYSIEVVEKVELKSRPDLGLIKSRCEARDEQDGALAMIFIAKGFTART